MKEGEATTDAAPDLATETPIIGETRMDVWQRGDTATPMVGGAVTTVEARDHAMATRDTEAIRMTAWRRGDTVILDQEGVGAAMTDANLVRAMVTLAKEDAVMNALQDAGTVTLVHAVVVEVTTAVSQGHVTETLMSEGEAMTDSPRDVMETLGPEDGAMIGAKSKHSKRWPEI